MKKKPTMKEQAAMVNNLCVKTYMDILGYPGGIVERQGLAIFNSPFNEAGLLYVAKQTNKFWLSHSRLKGGVLDLACAIFEETRSKNSPEYRALPYRFIDEQMRFPVWLDLVR